MKSPSHTPRIDCFLPYGSKEQITTLCGTLENSGLTGSIYILYHSDMDHSVAERYNSLHIDHTFSTQTIKEIARHCKAEYCLFYHKTLPLDLGFHALDRLLRVADDTQANMVYADHTGRNETCQTAYRLSERQSARRFRLRAFDFNPYGIPESLR